MAREQAAIGVDAGGTSTKAAVVDRAGRIVGRLERPTDPNAGTKGILSIVEDLLERSSSELDVVVEAVGVGAAGFVDASTGAITFAPNLVYDDPQIAEAVRSRVGLPVILDNDANVAAWGERAFGTAQGSDHVALVTLGTGIGSGFIVEGQLVRGFTGAGAEIGHTVIDPNGPQCKCGLRGCLEQFASGTAIERMAHEAVADDPQSTILQFAKSPHEIDAEDVTKAARQYDETARNILRRAGQALAVGLSNIVNVFDPEIIVLAGSVARAGEPFLGPARDELVRMTGAQRRRPVRIDITKLGGDAGLIGAAALAFDISPEDKHIRLDPGPRT
jgi:glucokinase